MIGNPGGPAWLGIGAQRAGTTWLTDLLTQHPEVTLGRSGRKELHAFNADLVDGTVAADYVAEFEGLPGYPGEFTPAYLRMPWVPTAVQQLCRPDVALIVLLRDPVDRFESAMRLFLDRQTPRRKAAWPDWARDKGVDATWAGMYATQLDVWASVFAPRQLIVMQYEQVIREPAQSVALIWVSLGLEPIGLSMIDQPSTTTVEQAEWSLNDHPGLREHLTGIYQPEVERLVSEWGIDRSLWGHFL